MKLLKVRKRKDSTSEDTHVTRGVIGAMIVIALIGWAFHRYAPILIAQLPPEQTVAVKTVKTHTVSASATRGPK